MSAPHEALRNAVTSKAHECVDMRIEASDVTREIRWVIDKRLLPHRRSMEGAYVSVLAVATK